VTPNRRRYPVTMESEVLSYDAVLHLLHWLR
jgi:hypothetical protein